MPAGYIIHTQTHTFRLLESIYSDRFYPLLSFRRLIKVIHRIHLCYMFAFNWIYLSRVLLLTGVRFGRNQVMIHIFTLNDHSRIHFC